MVSANRGDERRGTSAGPVLFVLSEDWFFASHFLTLAQDVRSAGHAVSVHIRVNDPELRSRIESEGLRVLPSRYDRERSGLAGDVAQILRFYRLFRREKPLIVHVISLRIVLMAGIAARLAGVPVRVHALTGMGVLGAGRSRKARLLLDSLGAVLRHALGGAGAGFIFENRDDPQRLGFARSRADLLVVGGAGIDPDRETVLPMPDGPTLRVAIVARMIRSKGIAVAVEALRRARAKGADLRLTLVGAADSGNPRSFTDAELAAFAAIDGVEWIGRTADVRAIWASHHVACVPSLGGEGLPRSLLEAAAAGRPIVTTDTPGCATFVRHLQEGVVVPPGDVDALADAFLTLAKDRDGVERMGAAARRRALEGFTRHAVSEAVIAFYAQLQSARDKRQRG